MNQTILSRLFNSATATLRAFGPALVLRSIKRGTDIAARTAKIANTAVNSSNVKPQLSVTLEIFFFVICIFAMLSESEFLDAVV